MNNNTPLALLTTSNYRDKRAAQSLVGDNEAQLLNYLKATDLEVGLLLNFGSEPEVRRKAFDNLRK